MAARVNWFEDAGGNAISVRGHRPSRLPFVAAVQVTSIDSGEQIAAQTQDLTRSGCFVETPTPFADGTKISLQISNNGKSVVTQGIVAYSRKGMGMGIGFTFMEPGSLPVLEAWLSELGA